MEKTTGDAPLLLTLSSKRCPCCGEIKPTTGFSRRKNNGKWCFDSYCKDCRNKKDKKYRLDNPEKFKRKYRKHSLKKKYGITIEDKERMLKNQGYKCAICCEELFLFGDLKDKNKIARVDHNHDTGEVRGLLCDKCNRGLGFFRDNEEYLINAASYLKEHKQAKPFKEFK